MRISLIEEIDKKRRVVFIDGEEAFTLYKNEVYKYQLKEDEELSEELYAEIMRTLNKRAKLKVMEYLQQSDKSEVELRTKLARARYPKMSIDAAIEYVRSYGYINDRRYAENYIRYKKQSKSKQAIAFELKKKGVDSSIIEECMEEEYSLDEELKAIRKQILKKCTSIHSLDSEKKKKLIASLCRKGFSYEKVNRTLSMMEEEEE